MLSTGPAFSARASAHSIGSIFPLVGTELVIDSRVVRVVMLSRPVLSVAGQLLIALGLLLLALQWKILRRGLAERWLKVGRARRPVAENS